MMKRILSCLLLLHGCSEDHCEERCESQACATATCAADCEAEESAADDAGCAEAWEKHAECVNHSTNPCDASIVEEECGIHKRTLDDCMGM